MPSEKKGFFFFFLIPREQKNKDQAKEEKIKTATTSSIKSQVKGWNESTDTSVAAVRWKIREKQMWAQQS